MPKVIISMEGIVIKEVQLSKDRTSLGRRPYNDIVIDNLAISGEHAVLQLSGHDVYVEDLNSTNGTFVNGKSIKRQALHNDDVIEIGKYRIQYASEAVPHTLAEMTGIDATSEGTALIRVMSGSAAGREVALLKVVTTIGKPAKRTTLNGMAVGDEPMAMKNGDMIELADTQMQFLHY
jgi:pSer/pThr/pTyr-binding forkhead associated (FHA) protein